MFWSISTGFSGCEFLWYYHHNDSIVNNLERIQCKEQDILRHCNFTILRSLPLSVSSSLTQCLRDLLQVVRRILHQIAVLLCHVPEGNVIPCLHAWLRWLASILAWNWVRYACTQWSITAYVYARFVLICIYMCTNSIDISGTGQDFLSICINPTLEYYSHFPKQTERLEFAFSPNSFRLQPKTPHLFGSVWNSWSISSFANKYWPLCMHLHSFEIIR